uniref:Uncharacterized protein n=1 Tax=Pithovirus LCPAC304 TaxID=2506594 RepID=A0A481Z7M7_9VIRU|nr:MAG: hypothetical protein LCPAC304_02130 [Pithovirus LCPAC304]
MGFGKFYAHVLRFDKIEEYRDALDWGSKVEEITVQAHTANVTDLVLPFLNHNIFTKTLNLFVCK